jgi:hypothetical protein
LAKIQEEKPKARRDLERRKREPHKRRKLTEWPRQGFRKL